MQAQPPSSAAAPALPLQNRMCRAARRPGGSFSGQMLCLPVPAGHGPRHECQAEEGARLTASCAAVAGAGSPAQTSP